MLDLDATDIPLYGCELQRFFHGYYDFSCDLPLYRFRPLSAAWRQGFGSPTRMRQRVLLWSVERIAG